MFQSIRMLPARATATPVTRSIFGYRRVLQFFIGRSILSEPVCLANSGHSCYYPATLMAGRNTLCGSGEGRAARFVSIFVVVAALAGCGVTDTRYYLSAFDQNQELRELFRLFN